MEVNAVVVDTCALVAFLERDGAETAAALRAFDRLLVPAAVDAEFRAGCDPATRSGRRRAAVLDEFLRSRAVEFLPAGREESSLYSELFRHLKAAGTPVPSNDIWIAAAALVRNVPVCTTDRHYSRFPLLRLVVPEGGA